MTQESLAEERPNGYENTAPKLKEGWVDEILFPYGDETRQREQLACPGRRSADGSRFFKPTPGKALPPDSMNPKTALSSPSEINRLILSVRDQRVILDRDLARIYGVETRALNQAIKRNPDRFPGEFVCELTREEILSISQTVTSLRNLRFSRQVRAFTEHGALMAATVLNSPRAVKMSLFIIRAFVRSREQQAANLTILKRVAEIDRTLLAHDVALRDLYQKLCPLLLPPPESGKKEIGFHSLKQLPRP